MKLNHLFLLCVAVSACAISCRKTDSPLLNSAETASTEAVSPGNGTVTGFNTLNNWQSVKTSGSVVEYSNIADSSINAGVFTSGLVLVYKKTGNSIQALPFEETGGSGNAFWSYQVSEKNILITREGSASLQTAGENSFRYIVLSPEKVSSLEKQGVTRDKLMKSSYETVISLVN